jgi:hypothetical protein
MVRNWETALKMFKMALISGLNFQSILFDATYRYRMDGLSMTIQLACSHFILWQLSAAFLTGIWTSIVFWPARVLHQTPLKPRNFDQLFSFLSTPAPYYAFLLPFLCLSWSFWSYSFFTYPEGLVLYCLRVRYAYPKRVNSCELILDRKEGKWEEKSNQTISSIATANSFICSYISVVLSWSFMLLPFFLQRFSMSSFASPARIVCLALPLLSPEISQSNSSFVYPGQLLLPCLALPCVGLRSGKDAQIDPPFSNCWSITSSQRENSDRTPFHALSISENNSPAVGQYSPGLKLPSYFLQACKVSHLAFPFRI